jgi:hypothetical protein
MSIYVLMVFPFISADAPRPCTIFAAFSVIFYALLVLVLVLMILNANKVIASSTPAGASARRLNSIIYVFPNRRFDT